MSYPATQPFTFTITFSDTLNEELPQRKLLDIEKEEFVPRTDTLYVTVSALLIFKSFELVNFGVQPRLAVAFGLEVALFGISLKFL